MILPIAQYGDQILREKTKSLKEVDMKTIKLIRDMFETLKHSNGIGLAANQISSDKSLFVLDLSDCEGYEKQKPLVLINPEIITTSDETWVMEEGCLSLPNLRADVERPASVRIKFLDTNESEQILDADELLARVILHEYDHLIAKMIPDRVGPWTKKKIKGRLMRIMRRQEEVDYPITERK